MTIETLIHDVDALGALDREIKALTKRADVIKARIKAAGAGEQLGAEYRALVIESAPITRTDWATIAAKFNPSRQLIAAHSTVGEPVLSVRVNRLEA